MGGFLEKDTWLCLGGGSKGEILQYLLFHNFMNMRKYLNTVGGNNIPVSDSQSNEPVPVILFQLLE